jgi:hypothetical protein
MERKASGRKTAFVINMVSKTSPRPRDAYFLTNWPLAAMPSLHFGYSLMIGLTIMTIPLPTHHRRTLRIRIGPLGLRIPSWRRLLCAILGFLYPFIILVAIVSTANHFILDAVAGAFVCGLGWWSNGVLLNLLPVEDYFLWLVRIHKPEPSKMQLSDNSSYWDSDESDTRQP